MIVVENSLVRHKHKCKVGATVIRTLAVLLAMVCVVACGTSAKRSDSPTSAPSRTGLIVINPQFDWAGQFSEALAQIRIGDDKTGKWGFIDKQGHLVVNPQFDWAGQFSEGLAEVRIGDNQTGKWGYIDKQGHYVVNPQFDWAGQFNERLAQVRIGDDKTGKWGFIAR